MAKSNFTLDTGVINAEFQDLDGHVFSKFRLNPMDIGLATRATEVSGFFESLTENKPQTLGDMIQLNKDIEEKISYVLGYDSSKEVFGEVSAVTVLPDGSLFVEHVVDKIYDIAKPAINERKKAMQEHIGKYTTKYEG